MTSTTATAATAVTAPPNARPPLRKGLPPGPRGLPFIGTAIQVSRDPLAFLLELGHHYGPVSFTRFGPYPTYMLNTPALIEQVLMGQHKDCVKDKSTRDLMPLAGNGLLTSEGELWRRQRKLAAPPLQPKRIAGYAATMRECAERELQAIADGSERDLHADFMRLTLEIVGKTLVGIDATAQAERISHVIDVFMAYFERQAYSWQGILPLHWPTPQRLRMRKAVAELDRIIQPMIDRFRRGEGDRETLLGRLVEARDDDGQPMSDQQLRDEVVTMLLAGHETTALTLCYTAFLLCRHPEVQARLRDEVDSAFAANVDSMQLAALPYLNAVVRETLRLYPPAYAMGREVVEPFVIDGFAVQRGDQLLMSQWAVHRDPRVFEQPERFLPERWLDPAIEKLPRFAYFPFGGGPRVCIGNHFAQMEIALVLATLVHTVDLELAPDYAMKLSPLVTLRVANGVPARVRRRAR